MSKYEYIYAESDGPLALEGGDPGGAISREDAVNSVRREFGVGYIAKVEEVQVEPSMPDAEDLVYQALELTDASSHWCELVDANIDLKALQTKIDPLIEQIKKLVSEAIHEAAGGLYVTGEIEFIGEEDDE
jgi:hypothetical protein